MASLCRLDSMVAAVVGRIRGNRRRPRCQLTGVSRCPSRQPAERESSDRRQEKVIASGRQGTVCTGPLQAGSYELYEDFNPGARDHNVVR
jgi:hypothetical protein